MLIDAHQHFWSLATPGHEWPGAEEAPIHRDFAVADLIAASAGVGLDGTVLVQSQPSDADTDWMLRLAEFRPYVGGAVWRGTATRWSAVHLDLYCDDP